MFFNLGPFHFGRTEQELPQNAQTKQDLEGQEKLEEQTQNGDGDLYGGFNNFCRDSFMNPFIQPKTNLRQQQQKHQSLRLSYIRQGTTRQAQQQQGPKIEQSEKAGMHWKQKANEQFSQGRLSAALKCYDEAILLNSTETIFYSNRARCLKKMGSLDLALKDAQSAIQLDPENIKGHFLCGQILAEIGKRTKDIGKVSNSLICLTRALTLCVGQLRQAELQSEIVVNLYRVKKLIWYMKLQEIRERRMKGIVEYEVNVQIIQCYLKESEIDQETTAMKLSEFIGATNENIILQIPDYLICRITLDLMEDPVITDSGQAYERQAIQEHIDRNGLTDPFTRQPISGILYPCITIRKAIQEFLDKNPWAYQFSEGETSNDINF